MDSSATPMNPNPNPQPVMPHPNLIRTDQVQKLPHLDQKQKIDHINLVRGLWETVNTRDTQNTEYQQAVLRLAHISQNLMRGMRAFQQNRQQQAAATAAAAAAANNQRQPGAVQQQPQQRGPQVINPQSFAQLFPHIQQKINNIQLFPPINLSAEQIPQWLAEAKLRYGIALQKHEIGRAKMAELRQHLNQRGGAQNMTREELAEVKHRQMMADKIVREGTEFVSRFREQQEIVKSQRAGVASQQQQHTGLAANQPTGTTNNGPQQPPSQVPAPHTINSAVTAVTAARNQANHQPSVSQQRQGSLVASGTQHHPATSQKALPGASAPGTPPSTASQQPRSMSQHTAMQSAQSLPNNASHQPQHQQPQLHQQQNNVNSQQPPGYMPNRSPENSTRNTHMPIPKNLNVTAPEPVPMAAARPTLSGGPSHGAMGIMGQPAIQKHPGYVLEGEGQRVLSKKMLDILVRQVTGGGSGEGLTPDAEEVIFPRYTHIYMFQIKLT